MPETEVNLLHSSDRDVWDFARVNDFASDPELGILLLERD